MNYASKMAPHGQRSTKKISVSIGERVWKEATAFAKAEGITLSGMIEIALRTQMDSEKSSIEDRLKKLESTIATLKPAKK